MNQLVEPDVERKSDHVLSQEDCIASIVNYGDYQCGECGRFKDILRRVLDDDGIPVNYVFRHLPLGKSKAEGIARAVAAEAAARQGKFWEMHDALFRHADDTDAIGQAADEAGLDLQRFEKDQNDPLIRDGVERDIEAALAQGIDRVPTLFIRGREYLGVWDLESITEAVQPPIARRVNELASDFARWAAASGAVLILFATIALIWRNSPLGEQYEAFWQSDAGLMVAGQSLTMSLHHWVNDLFMAVFFLVVGLELKREALSGQLAEIRRAAFPAAAALGGMIVPALIYLGFNWGTAGAAGWGVPMATDIAFTLGVLALLGSRVPTSMKVFATALAIVDDLGAILVLAIAYNHGISWTALSTAALFFLVLVGFNRARVYALWPYLLLGALLWLAVYFSGLHATLAGVMLAATIPTRSKPSLSPLLAQESVRVSQARRQIRTENGREADERERLANRVKVITARLHPPAERLEHALQPWSSYFVLPIFALVNAGIAISANSVSFTNTATLGIVMGLVLGKPLGILAATWLVDRAGIGKKPDDATWMHIIAVGCLCGIGFTMSIFIASEAFSPAESLADAKFAVMAGSIIAALLGVVWLRLFCPESESSGD